MKGDRKYMFSCFGVTNEIVQVMRWFLIFLTGSCKAITFFKECPQVALRRDGTHGAFQRRSPGLHWRLSARDRQLRVQLQRGGQSVRIHKSREAPPCPRRRAGITLSEGGL